MHLRSVRSSRRLLLVLSVIAMITGLLAAPGSVAAGEEPSAPETVGDNKHMQLFTDRSKDVAKLDCKHISPYDVGGCSLVVRGFTNETMTVAVWETDAKAVQLFTGTFLPTADATFIEAGDLKAGNHVVVSSSNKTLESTVATMTAAIDWENDIVRGTISPTGRADVWVISKETFNTDGSALDVCGRVVFPDALGNWTADFSTPVDPGDEDVCQSVGAVTTYDFGPGDMVVAFDAFSGNPTCQGCSTDTMARVPDFLDDDSSAFELDITWLAESGITKGCNPPDNDMFCPDDPVTRGQMAAFLVRALGYSDAGDGDLFTDDDGSVFELNIDKLGTAGVTKGCNPPTNDMFCPNANVTRGQMAAFLVRALNLTDDGGGNNFIDDGNSIFQDQIARLAAAGITRGCNPPTNDMFCPTANVTRGQMAAFLRRALG